MLKRKPMIQVVITMAAALLVLSCSEDDNDDDSNNDDTGDPETEDTGDTATGDSETESTDDTGTGDSEEGEDGVINGTLVVPESFDGTPVMFGSMFFASDNLGGMPDGFGNADLDLDAVSAGNSVDFTTTQGGLTGDYYLAVVLYCEGGGGGQFPVAGVDWVGAAGEILTLGPGTGSVDAGQLELIIAEE